MVNSDLVIKEFKEAVTKLYGNRLDRIILYGSRARGDHREDSDFDFAVVLKDEKVNAFKEIEQITDAVFPFVLKLGAEISYKPMNNFLLNQPDKVFYHFVRTEGVSV